MVKKSYISKIIIIALTIFISCNKENKDPVAEINLLLNSNIQNQDIEDLSCKNELAINGDSYTLYSLKIKENQFKNLIEEINIKDFTIYGESIMILNKKNNIKLSINKNKNLILYIKTIE